jgi:4'-phosphopantetheinyl transferase
MIGVRVHVSRVIREGGASSDHVLNSAERIQAERFLLERDRSLFRNGRIQRRLVLGSYLNADPASLTFVTGPHGKPRLLSSDVQPVNFNTSHSAGVNVIAVVLGSTADVGVDIEHLERPIPEMLWHTCLSPNERKMMIPVHAGLRKARFMRLWTCKEAVMKASGRGLHVDPASIDIDPESFEIRTLPGELGDKRSYQLEVREIMDGFSLAVCTIGEATYGLEIDIVCDEA